MLTTWAQDLGLDPASTLGTNSAASAQSLGAVQELDDVFLVALVRGIIVGGSGSALVSHAGVCEASEAASAIVEAGG